MICPTCNIQMDHLNKGGGSFGTEAYTTFDYVECPLCKTKAIEYYHTEIVGDIEGLSPEFNLKYNA